MEQKSFESWAIVEIFGHVRLAGLVSEATIGGCSFVRVDVPASEDGKRQGFTRFYGQGAIYSLTIVTEEVAKAALEQMQPRGVSVYDLPRIEASKVTSLFHDDYTDNADEYDESRDEDYEF